MKALIFAVLIAIAFPATAAMPEVLEAALEGYIENGSEEFVDRLVKGSALEGEKSAVMQGTMLRQIQTFYGTARSWEYLVSCPFTDRIRTSYFVVYFDKGPLYGLLDTLVTTRGSEITIRFVVHTEAGQVLPRVPVAAKDLCSTI